MRASRTLSGTLDMDPENATRYTCVGCGMRAPERTVDTPLLSSYYKWRLTRRTSEDGSIVPEWRCPSCWSTHKAAQTQAHVSSPPSIASIAPIPPVERKPGD